ncbi:asparagine synthase (glutamine-hydrolyzing), partial [Candidatus Wolfebacteria bacterium CG03_land_8_20_14_0_80_40_12]
GIAGIYLNKKTVKKEQKELAAVIKKMNESQKRRGPDDEGIFSFERGVFGHRRLSIIDLSKAGHQPMIFNIRTSDVHRTSDVPKLAIAFNGEIYNFLELRKELEKKSYKFKTKTDTEVILALYAEYKEKSFSMLRGMFAFGLWDARNQRLFLVKDRYGIKPLYYYSDNEKLVFASTVKAIAESGLVPIKKNPDAFIGFLLFGSVPLPLTTIKNVLAVPAGHYLVRDADGSQKLIKYYEPLEFFNIRTSDVLNIDDNFGTSDVQKIVRQICNILEDSVKLHLISDAPLGIFLSGGLDSSVLAALAAFNIRTSDVSNIKNLRLKTLSIIFDEPEFSEEYYSDLVAQKIGSDHRKIKITKQDFYNSFDEIFEAMDQPTIDGVNTFFIAKAAKQAGLKTVLSGLGADEIFLGYPHFRRAELLRKIQKLPKFIKLPLFNYPITQLLNYLTKNDRYSKLSYFAKDDILSFYLGIRGLFAPQEAAKILDANLSEMNKFLNDFLKLETYKLTNLQTLSPVNLLSYLELKFYLQNQLLKDTDFMSMYHSIEVRVPFLDHPLVEYLSGLSPNVKLGKEINKPLLVEAVRELLPQ